MKTEKLYERYYDNPDREPENYLGEFRTIHQLREDFYVDDDYILYEHIKYEKSYK